MLLERVDYEYELGSSLAVGNATKITRRVVGDDVFEGTCLKHRRQGELRFVTKKSWEVDEFGRLKQLTAGTGRRQVHSGDC